MQSPYTDAQAVKIHLLSLWRLTGSGRLGNTLGNTLAFYTWSYTWKYTYFSKKLNRFWSIYKYTWKYTYFLYLEYTYLASLVPV